MESCRMDKEELVTLKVAIEKGITNAEILGVNEGTVRYYRRKAQSSEAAGGFEKPFKAEALAEAIEHWVETNSHERRQINVKELLSTYCTPTVISPRSAFFNTLNNIRCNLVQV